MSFPRTKARSSSKSPEERVTCGPGETDPSGSTSAASLPSTPDFIRPRPSWRSGCSKRPRLSSGGRRRSSPGRLRGCRTCSREGRSRRNAVMNAMESSPTEITAEELRRWLEEGRPVSVLDVRRAADRSEWSIPGRVHADVYDALWAGDTSALDSIDLPPDRPVVTVCNRGRTSLKARELLEKRGYHAISLAGGMKAWSLAWNKAEVPLSDKGQVRVIQFRRTGKGCLSYLVGSHGVAVVIDPSIDPQVYEAEARSLGWKIIASLDTHVHADHLTRSRLISSDLGSEVRLPETTRAGYPYRPLRDSEAIRVGDVDLTVMRTPGHTPESVCYRLDNRALFTGDTLFIAGVGRPDLEASASGAEKRAHALYRSLRHILSLSDEMLILPGHTGQPVPFDGRAITSTLAEVRDRVNTLPQEESAFVQHIMAHIPPTPPNHHEIVKMNEKGLFPKGDPTDLEAGANRCAVS